MQISRTLLNIVAMQFHARTLPVICIPSCHRHDSSARPSAGWPSTILLLHALLRNCQRITSPICAYVNHDLHLPCHTAQGRRITRHDLFPVQYNDSKLETNLPLLPTCAVSSFFRSILRLHF